MVYAIIIVNGIFNNVTKYPFNSAYGPELLPKII
jgi:hypothetical protein